MKLQKLFEYIHKSIDIVKSHLFPIHNCSQSMTEKIKNNCL